MEKKEGKRFKEAMLKVYSSDQATTLKGLKSIRDVGDVKAIRPLLEVYLGHEDEVIKTEIEDILSNLKVEGAADPLVKALEEEKFLKVNSLILTALWSSGLYPSEHIDRVTGAALRGDYMCAIEAVTVIENMEGPFQYEALEEASILVDEYLSEETEDPKVALVESLRELLLDFRSNID